MTNNSPTLPGLGASLDSAAQMLFDASKAMRKAYREAKTAEALDWLVREARDLDDKIAALTRHLEDEQSIDEAMLDAGVSLRP